MDHPQQQSRTRVAMHNQRQGARMPSEQQPQDQRPAASAGVQCTHRQNQSQQHMQPGCTKQKLCKAELHQFVSTR